jgi:S-formylglutathione hydrolase FrmB
VLAAATSLGLSLGSSASAVLPVLTGGPVLVGGTAHTDDGSYPVDETQVADGMVDVDIYSAVFHGKIRVRVILPVDWAAQPTRTWPTVYALMGGTGPGESFAGGGFTSQTQLAPFMSSRDVLTVIPDDDHAGWFANWVGPDFNRGNTKPQFETFDAVELPQILTRDYRSSGRNVALGVSLGGNGGIYLAAAHPGLFQAVASMSGLLNLKAAEAWPIVAATEVRVGDDPWGPFGDPTLNAANWTAHNPSDIAAKLHGVKLFVSAGNGLPSSYDPTAPIDGDALESVAGAEAHTFVAKATAAGDSVTTDFYGPGAHAWPFWDREIPTAWKVLSQGLGLPAS